MTLRAWGVSVSETHATDSMFSVPCTLYLNCTLGAFGVFAIPATAAQRRLELGSERAHGRHSPAARPVAERRRAADPCLGEAGRARHAGLRHVPPRPGRLVRDLRGEPRRTRLRRLEQGRPAGRGQRAADRRPLEQAQGRLRAFLLAKAASKNAATLSR